MDKKKLQQELDRQTEEIEKMIQADSELKDMKASDKFKEELYKKIGKLSEEKSPDSN